MKSKTFFNSMKIILSNYNYRIIKLKIIKHAYKHRIQYIKKNYVGWSIISFLFTICKSIKKKKITIE